MRGQGKGEFDTMTRETNRWTALRLGLGLVVSLSVARAARSEAAPGPTVSRDGVTAWISGAAFSGEMASLEKGSWERLPAGELPRIVAGYPVLASKTTVVALSHDGKTLSVYTRRDGRLTRRGQIHVSSEEGAARFKLAADAKQPGLAVGVFSQDDKLRGAVSLRPDGIIEIKQPPGREVVVRSRMEYALVPSLIGTDLLFDPDTYPDQLDFYLPSMNMVVGLMDEGNCTMVGAWPPGEQLASLRMEKKGTRRAIGSFALGTDGRSFYLAYIEHPKMWHQEQLKAEYLEKHTAIAWQRPFDARWIGRFTIQSEQYDFPFYIAPKKMKLWGRCIRGWFYYPFWFDGARTMVHFEKKFPPVGRLLIYYLETHKGGPDILSPVAVMQKSLGEETAARLLDFEGTRELVLLEHRNAVCAMTRKIEKHFAGGNELKQRAEVDRYADDVATFIRLIRERVFAYERFAGQTAALLKDHKQADPALAGDTKRMEELLAEIRETAREDLPKTSLEQVREWTDGIKNLAAEVRPGNSLKVKALGQLCRSVAGSQDDLARNLSILTIRLMEEAAVFGIKSPGRAKLAEQLIGRCRAILRRPTWWEPCRKYMPKSDPGAP